jgi:hypothetical protein
MLAGCLHGIFLMDNSSCNIFAKLIHKNSPTNLFTTLALIFIEQLTCIVRELVKLSQQTIK